MRLRYTNPPLHIRNMRGEYPSNLTFGFEAETSHNDCACDILEYPEYQKDFSTIKFLQKMRKESENFYFFKEDGSISGVEFVTHPFDWNWYLNNKKVLNWFSKSRKYGFDADRDCGFHVHVGRKFFTHEHLLKMLRLYYFNVKFMKKISKRTRFGYCSPCIFKKWDSAVRYSGNSMESRNFWDEHAKDSALNLWPRNTIEVRLFQGTTNKNLIKAYLEFVRASIMFTKEMALKQITAKNFRKWIRARKVEYAYANRLVSKPDSFRM